MPRMPIMGDCRYSAHPGQVYEKQFMRKKCYKCKMFRLNDRKFVGFRKAYKNYNLTPGMLKCAIKENQVESVHIYNYKGNTCTDYILLTRASLRRFNKLRKQQHLNTLAA